jgi:hypothetical protein
MGKRCPRFLRGWVFLSAHPLARNRLDREATGSLRGRTRQSARPALGARTGPGSGRHPFHRTPKWRSARCSFFSGSSTLLREPKDDGRAHREARRRHLTGEEDESVRGESGSLYRRTSAWRSLPPSASSTTSLPSSRRVSAITRRISESSSATRILKRGGAWERPIGHRVQRPIPRPEPATATTGSRSSARHSVAFCDMTHAATVEGRDLASRGPQTSPPGSASVTEPSASATIRLRAARAAANAGASANAGDVKRVGVDACRRLRLHRAAALSRWCPRGPSRRRDAARRKSTADGVLTDEHAHMKACSRPLATNEGL